MNIKEPDFEYVWSYPQQVFVKDESIPETLSFFKINYLEEHSIRSNEKIPPNSIMIKKAPDTHRLSHNNQNLIKNQ